MTIQEYLSHVPNDEITNRLRYIDQSLMELHQHGYYVVCNIAEIEIIDNKVTLASFKDKVDYLDSGINPNGDKQDIIELCSIGICAYNHFDKFYSSPKFIENLIDNLDLYIDNGKVPKQMRGYYEDVFIRGNIIYLNIYLLSTDIDYNAKQIPESNGMERGKVKVYSTDVGRALSNRENDQNAAFANVLLIPSVIVLIYLLFIVIYFVFFK